MLGTIGRRGPAKAIPLLDQIDGPWPSWLERRFLVLLSRLGFKDYEREYKVLGRYRIDFTWPHLKLGVESHGAKWHVRKWQLDLDRHNAMTAEGWTMLHFTSLRMKEEESEVERLLSSTYLNQSQLWCPKLV